MSVGGVGIVSVAAHVVGRRIKAMVDDYVQGRIEEAAKTHRELLPLFKVLFITANPIMVKSALKLLGFEVGTLRLPLIEATSEQVEELKAVLQGLGLV
jgi:4-hydroxy-tetrahydrodipicolinate synthase